MPSSAIIHLTGSSGDHQRLLDAIEIAALLDWSDLTVTDPSGNVQPISPDEQARLLEEAERRAAGSHDLFDPIPSPGPIMPIRPIIYACPKDRVHLKHIAFEGDPTPMCRICHPPVFCVPWQPGE